MTSTPPQPTAASKLASILSKLSPVPGFPEYTGPYKTGTVDVEIPVSELESPSPAPDTAADILTVQFRIFYPTGQDTKGKRITWLPAPQRHHVSAYTKFIGVGNVLAELVSFLPRHMHYITIPAHKNATLSEPNTPNGRWPTVIFSHGLGGSRNAYSHFAGSLASHGVVVICPEHRDGSSVASFVRIPSEQDRYFIRNTRRVVPYNRIPHETTPEIYLQREAQLRIRLWELGLVHAAVLAIDTGSTYTNLNTSTGSAQLDQFVGKMHIHEPGSIIFAGHSFGASTMVQLLKTTYYAGLPELDAMENPLYTPRKDSALGKQITEKNITMLLDMWCFPLLAPNSSPLFNLPLPVYADVPSAPGGNALLAADSEAFHNWADHLHVTARVLSPDPSAKTVSAQSYERPSGVRLPEPNFFWLEKSAHLSQSDFAILFPWLTKKIFSSVEPERALRLNLRAQLQLLRMNGVPVARTWVGDLVDGAQVGKLDAAGTESGNKDVDDGIHDDKAILDRSGSAVEFWHWIDGIGMGEAPNKKSNENSRENDVRGAESQEHEMESEIEPGVEAVPATVKVSA